MFSDNPFAALSQSISPAIMQAYVVVMIVLVAAGTLFDMLHKQSARYFFREAREAKEKRKRALTAGDLASAAIGTVGEALVSGEFCSLKRRLAHLLTMYGFLMYAVATFVMVFWYPAPDAAAPAILPVLWHVGAAMVLIGGCWFWFFIRVDVSAEGHSPFRLVQADLFIAALLKSVALGLIWSYLQSIGSPWANVFLALYLIATTVLFASVPWSKFSHMFYKPAAAFQKRMEEAGGTHKNLPSPAAKPETFGSAREAPRHY